jgi:hypothetical protein
MNKKIFTLKLNLEKQRQVFLKCFKEVEDKNYNNENGTSQCKTKDGLYYHSKIELINDTLNNTSELGSVI